MTFHEVGYQNYNVTMKLNNYDILVATIQPPLIGTDAVFINICFPFDHCTTIRLDTTHLFEDDILEKAKRIITKKLYKMQTDIISELRSVTLDEDTCKKKYRLSETCYCNDMYVMR